MQSELLEMQNPMYLYASVCNYTCEIPCKWFTRIHDMQSLIFMMNHVSTLVRLPTGCDRSAAACRTSRICAYMYWQFENFHWKSAWLSGLFTDWIRHYALKIIFCFFRSKNGICWKLECLYATTVLSHGFFPILHIIVHVFYPFA